MSVLFARILLSDVLINEPFLCYITFEVSLLDFGCFSFILFFFSFGFSNCKDAEYDVITELVSVVNMWTMVFPWLWLNQNLLLQDLPLMDQVLPVISTLDPLDR